MNFYSTSSSFPINFDAADEVAFVNDLTSERAKAAGERTDLDSNPSGLGTRKNTAQHLKNLIANSQSNYTTGNMETTASRGIQESSMKTQPKNLFGGRTTLGLHRDSHKQVGGLSQTARQSKTGTKMASSRLFFPTAVDDDDAILEQSHEGGDRLDRSRTQGELSIKKSFRTQRAGSASATKCLNALSFSNLELNMMNNACNTPLQQVVGTNLSAVKDSLGVQRMIRDVRGALLERTQRETQFLSHKNLKMVAALNEMKHHNALQLQRLEALRRELKKDGLCIVRQNNTATKVSNLKTRCARTHSKLVAEMKQQERLKRIIEICNLNKDANEDCTRQLNYLVTNLDKLAKILEKKIEQIDKEGDSLEELIKSTRNAQKEKSNNTSTLLKIVTSNFETQKQLDKDFMETNISWVGGNTNAAESGRFRENLLKDQLSYTQGPIVQKKKEELGADRDNGRLLDEFREDIQSLCNVFRVTPQELLATKGKLSTLPRFREQFSSANQIQHLENLQRTLADLHAERRSLDCRKDFYQYMKDEERVEDKREQLRRKDELRADLETQRQLLNKESRTLISQTQTVATCKTLHSGLILKLNAAVSGIGRPVPDSGNGAEPAYFTEAFVQKLKFLVHQVNQSKGQSAYQIADDRTFRPSSLANRGGVQLAPLLDAEYKRGAPRVGRYDATNDSVSSPSEPGAKKLQPLVMSGFGPSAHGSSVGRSTPDDTYNKTNSEF